MKRSSARLLKFFGYAVCIVTPMAAVIDQFGYLIGKQDTSFVDLIPCSGLVLFLLLLCLQVV